jgi:pyridinium-3,5-bisthiocarboxylic acid mononucleotide nickel chelatase
VSLQGLHLHFEPISGIAGDMAVASLVDAGVPAKVVVDAVRSLGVRGLKTTFERRKRGAFVGRGFAVSWPGKPKAAPERARPPAAGRVHNGHPEPAHAHDHEPAHLHDHEHDHDHEHADEPEPDRAPAPHAHRDYADIKRLLARARFDPHGRALAAEIFARIAEVEAELHGTRVDRVAFHEVGAYDSIADVVGIAAAIAWLEPTSIGSLPPVVGTGRVRTAHGPVPVPAPATAALLAGIPILPEGEGELTTPTGAAILAAVVDEFGPLPPLRIRAVGYGAGVRELADRPNLLRVVVGETLGDAEEPAAPEVTLVEANVDDMNPQLVAPLMEALLVAGALDVWSTGILMKKGRPALQVSALAPPPALAEVQRAFFRNSTTLGVRMHPLGRAVLSRAFARVDTPFGPVRVKIAALDGEVLGAQPEFEDCRRLAGRARVPVRQVLAAATAAAAAHAAPAGVRKRAKGRA